MTQEQDIVERLLKAAALRPPLLASPMMEEAAQTIAALRAERDEGAKALQEMQKHMVMVCVQREEANAYGDEGHERAEAAEARVKEMEAEISNLDAELDHWSQLAVDDLGKNPPTSWKEIADTAIRERDEARKALEPFANAADDLDDQDEDHYVSSNREGGEE